MNDANAPTKSELQRNAEKARALIQANVAQSLASGTAPPRDGAVLEPLSDPLLFPAEVRALVRLSEPTLYRLRKKRKFPEPLVLGERRIAWRRSVILAWLASRKAA